MCIAEVGASNPSGVTRYPVFKQLNIFKIISFYPLLDG
jgi:hypothetical protein